MKEELKRALDLLDEIESQTLAEESREIEDLEELKIKVRPKMVVAARELTDVANIFRAFWYKHQNDSRTVFTNTLEFYLDALKFDP